MTSRGTLSGLRWWPFIILAGACLIILLSDQGKASAMGPLTGVRVLILVSGLVMAVFLEIMARMLESRRRLATGYDASPEAARAILDATAGLTRVLSLAIAVFMALLAVPHTWLPGLGPGRALGLGTGVILGAIVWAVWSLKSVHGGLERTGQLGGLEGWNGIIYNNPKDPRLWVPKVSGFGTTLNFAHTRAWVMLGSILVFRSTPPSLGSSRCSAAEQPGSGRSRLLGCAPPLDHTASAGAPSAWQAPHTEREGILEMGRLTASIVLVCVLVLGLSSGKLAAQGQPDGQLTIAFDTSIAPTFLDPAETPGIGTPFVFLYALHDALIKPLPGNDMAPCVAESWRESPDGLVYEFKLREGLRFHNGDPVTAEDVKFSFQRYRGASTRLLHERVKAVDIIDPHRIRFVLHTPWPDFLVFYATPATGAAWVVPKKYIEKVGEDGFKRQPVGLGPYRFVRMTPGIEIVLEANEQYWRKKPTIKRVVIKGVPDRTTRLAMLKTGEADIGYLMVGLEAATIKADPKLRLARVIAPATWWLEFPEQWNPKSPWSDRRVRLAANLAMDKQAINEAERLGYSRLTGSIIPSGMDFALRIDAHPYDPTHAKRLLADAGYPSGFDAGDLTPLPPFTTMGEAVATQLASVGIRTRQRSMERATFMEAWRSKKLGGVIVTVSAAPGSTAVRLESFVISSAPYAAGGYPDIDELFRQQAQERDRKKREAVLHQIQRLMHERIMFGPIFEPATLHGVGPRVEEAAIGLNTQLYFAAPYEDMRLKKP